jgi:hypothetical protein
MYFLPHLDVWKLEPSVSMVACRAIFFYSMVFIIDATLDWMEEFHNLGPL